MYPRTLSISLQRDSFCFIAEWYTTGWIYIYTSYPLIKGIWVVFCLLLCSPSQNTVLFIQYFIFMEFTINMQILVSKRHFPLNVMSRQEEDKVNFAYFVSEIKDVLKDINEHVPRIPYYQLSSHMIQNAVYSINNTFPSQKCLSLIWSLNLILVFRFVEFTWYLWNLPTNFFYKQCLGFHKTTEVRFCSRIKPRGDPNMIKDMHFKITVINLLKSIDTR